MFFQINVALSEHSILFYFILCDMAERNVFVQIKLAF